jgi:purine-binding chemotaxis protein CheW
MSMVLMGKTREYLIFKLGSESCAVDAARVQGILGRTHILRIMHGPAFIHGLVNMRGHILPVIDLRKKFIWAHPLKSANQCIIVLEVPFEDGVLLVGVLADAVSEMTKLTREDIWPVSEFDDRFYTDFFRGLGRKGRDPYLILDVDRIFSNQDIDQIVTAMHDPTEAFC